jgi:hypothetical protein
MRIAEIAAALILILIRIPSEIENYRSALLDWYFFGRSLYPVGADEEPAHENGRRTGERSIAEFDPSATRTGALRQ